VAFLLLSALGLPKPAAFVGIAVGFLAGLVGVPVGMVGWLIFMSKAGKITNSGAFAAMVARDVTRGIPPARQGPADR
jgi:hypothetical protein